MRAAAAAAIAIILTAGCGRSSEPGSQRAAGAREPLAAPTTAAIPPANGSILAPGDDVPEAVLAGARHWQRGGAAGNRVLVITFASTTCAETGPCALSEQRLRDVQTLLHKSPSLAVSVGMLTLSDDPAHDVPAVLRAHADRVRADPSLWRFAALPPGQVNEILVRFQSSAAAPALAIVDSDGKLARNYSGVAWTAAGIVEDLQSLVLRADPAVLSAYIAIQEALAADDLAAAKRALRQLQHGVHEPGVTRLVATAAAADTLAATRKAFKPLSEALVRLPWPREYQPMYCPMFEGNAGATWVQKSGPVANPYYGKAMLHCGTDMSVGAHSDHSPRHGGVLFMAADAFHHVEGTYTPDGVFRLYVYDNFKQPMKVKGLGAQLEIGSRANGRPIRMTAATDGATLNARVGQLAFPAELTVKMQFTANGGEERFDFVFAAYSVAR